MNKNLLQGPHRRILAAAAVSAALLIPLGVFGAPALARSASAGPEHSGSAQYQYKIWVCHYTHSAKHPVVLIHVSSASLRGHLRHHDLVIVPPATCPTTPNLAAHGKANSDHGKANADHGKANADHGQSGQSHGKGK
jgi:hypothetical protein